MSLIPMMRCRDMRTSVAFYTRILDFELTEAAMTRLNATSSHSPAAAIDSPSEGLGQQGARSKKSPALRG
jgi:catechol 2,3-dioxygenase-like lactoylglutathione lyase family enzyme